MVVMVPLTSSVAAKRLLLAFVEQARAIALLFQLLLVMACSQNTETASTKSSSQ